MLSDVEKRNNLMLTPLTPVATLVTSWQSGFCLQFKLIKIFSDLLSMEAVQTCASTQWRSDF